MVGSLEQLVIARRPMRLHSSTAQDFESNFRTLGGGQLLKGVEYALGPLAHDTSLAPRTVTVKPRLQVLS